MTRRSAALSSRSAHPEEPKPARRQGARHAARHHVQLAPRRSTGRDRHRIRTALTSVPALEIEDFDLDFVPAYEPDDFRAVINRIDVDLREDPARTKEALQALAEDVARAFQPVVGHDRKVKVVIQPYDAGKSGWVSR